MNRLRIDHQALITRYLLGESEQSLSRDLRIARSVVELRLTEAGIPRRGRSEATHNRMERMTSEDRQILTTAARAVRSDVRTSESTRAKIATTRFSRGNQVKGQDEETLRLWLEDIGLNLQPQYPCGPYNIDLALYPLAVELIRNPHHPMTLPGADKRTTCLLQNGWSVVIVWFTPTKPITQTVAAAILGLYDRITGAPQPECWIIRGNGDAAPNPRPRHAATST